MSRSLSHQRADATTLPISTAETLRAGADHLRGVGPAGWAKGDFHVDGGDCALGVIALVMDGRCMTPVEYLILEQVLIAELKANHPELLANNIADLNDESSYEDVLAAFEKAALKFEERVVE